MHDTDTTHWLTLLSAAGIGAATIRGLFEHFSTIDQLFAASDPALGKAGLTARQLHALRNPDAERIDVARRWLEHERHEIITLRDTRYPNALTDLPDAPVALFANGDISLLETPALAIVGSRNPTRGGADNATQFAKFMANRGLVIVSGLATGVDAAAHSGALDCDGATIAVLGNGPDQCYPPGNRALQQRIAEHGLILSEYLPGQPPSASQFPARNRIISGLALGVLVVEATKRSGSLITARMAGEQGRSVFAIPGSIHNPLARGCHQLIRQGALLVEQADDIFSEIGPRLSMILSATPAPAVATQNAAAAVADDDYSAVLDAMGWDPVSIDELVRRTALTAAELSSMLLIMELEGRVEQHPGGSFGRCRQQKVRS
ncbi:MAG: DNA-processing protein DprA [Pseudomonadota bacterium]